MSAGQTGATRFDRHEGIERHWGWSQDGRIRRLAANITLHGPCDNSLLINHHRWKMINGSHLPTPTAAKAVNSRPGWERSRMQRSSVRSTFCFSSPIESIQLSPETNCSSISPSARKQDFSPSEYVDQQRPAELCSHPPSFSSIRSTLLHYTALSPLLHLRRRNDARRRVS